MKEFITTLREVSNPLDMDYPLDKDLADACKSGKHGNCGKRMENINCASTICTKMITVKKC
jgi:hypothetical protein